MASTTRSSVTLAPDALDDLVYYSRTADLDSLRTLIQDLARAHAVPESMILSSAIDVDADGLGSKSCLLHYPAANGSVDVVVYLLSLVEPDTLQSSTALVNHQNVSGNTPLHWAAMNGHLEVAKLLVAAGADPSIVNGAGRDCVVEAEWSGKEEGSQVAVWLLGACTGLEKGFGGGESKEEVDDDGLDKSENGDGKRGMKDDLPEDEVDNEADPS